jgi:hypothetical protein
MATLSDKEIIAVIEEMTSHRAWIINSFSQIECRLGDLIVQCERFGEYEKLNKLQLPMGSGKRVERVRELMKSGPLAEHAVALDRVLTRFMEFEELRHMMTHGYAALHHTPAGDIGMTFIRFVPPQKGGRATQDRSFYRPDTMRRQRESSTSFGEEAMGTLRKVYEAVGLDPDLLAKLT